MLVPGRFFCLLFHLRVGYTLTPAAKDREKQRPGAGWISVPAIHLNEKYQRMCYYRFMTLFTDFERSSRYGDGDRGYHSWESKI